MYARNNRVRAKAVSFARSDAAARALGTARDLLLLGSLLALLLRTGAGAG